MLFIYEVPDKSKSANLFVPPIVPIFIFNSFFVEFLKNEFDSISISLKNCLNFEKLRTPTWKNKKL